MTKKIKNIILKLRDNISSDFPYSNLNSWSIVYRIHLPVSFLVKSKK